MATTHKTQTDLILEVILSYNWFNEISTAKFIQGVDKRIAINFRLTNISPIWSVMFALKM